MDAVTGAVVIAGLKYAGPPAASVVTNFLNRILSPAGDAMGEAAAYPIQEWQRKRVERAQAVVTDAAALLEQEGVEPRPVPGRTLMPLLERASVEEDGSLTDRWVRLLASAAAGDPKALPAFVAILSELAPEEVRLLDWLYRTTARISARGQYYSEVEINFVAQTLSLEYHFLEILIGNLVRLGLIRHPIEISGYDIEHIVENHRVDLKGGYSPTPAKDFEAMYVEGRFAMTDLGGAFIEACSYPKAVPDYMNPMPR